MNRVRRAIIELRPSDADPAVACDRGVANVSPEERAAHLPDCTLLLIDHGSLVARCSCWWRGTPVHEGTALGVIGHYAAADVDSGVALLVRACDVLASKGCATAVGPMDGNTWRRYRFIVERGSEPAFFLEPDNPDDWPRHWARAGFAELARYTSAVNDDLSRHDPESDAARARLTAAGFTIRAFDSSRADAELRRIFTLSLSAFRQNFLYTPISEQEFIAQNRAVLPHVRPDLFLLAERDDRLMGFLFCVPELLRAQRGAAAETMIIKTLAVDPSIRGIGLGGVLVEMGQRTARELGFGRAIHALIHDTNVSRKMSDRYARSIRRYALFSRSLVG